MSNVINNVNDGIDGGFKAAELAFGAEKAHDFGRAAMYFRLAASRFSKVILTSGDAIPPAQRALLEKQSKDFLSRSRKHENMLVNDMENRLDDLVDAPLTYERLASRLDKVTGRNQSPALTEDEARERISKLAIENKDDCGKGLQAAPPSPPPIKTNGFTEESSAAPLINIPGASVLFEHDLAGGDSDEYELLVNQAKEEAALDRSLSAAQSGENDQSLSAAHIDDLDTGDADANALIAKFMSEAQRGNLNVGLTTLEGSMSPLREAENNDLLAASNVVLEDARKMISASPNAKGCEAVECDKGDDNDDDDEEASESSEDDSDPEYRAYVERRKTQNRKKYRIF